MKRCALAFPLLIISMLFLNLKCKDDIVPPPPNNGPDTTSHDFSWTVTTLGDGSASTLNDVAIINDTLAYAVGEIYLKDSTGSIDPAFYNLAVWNGGQWTPQKVLYMGGIFQTNWILAFSQDDFWINRSVHWNGSNWEFIQIGNPIFNGIRTNKAWGTSSRDFYVVGDGGFIAHYNGTTWTKIESGTTLSMMDIWGDGNEILAVAFEYFTDQNSVLMRVNGATTTALSISGLSKVLYGVWFKQGGPYFATGEGAFYKKTLDVSTWTPFLSSAFSNRVLTCIRGNASNDLFVAGVDYNVFHYNGATWKHYPELKNSGGASGIAVRGNLVIICGADGSKGAISVGRRNWQ